MSKAPEKDVYGIGRAVAAVSEAAVIIFLIFVVARCSGVEVF